MQTNSDLSRNQLTEITSTVQRTDLALCLLSKTCICRVALPN